MGKKIPLKSVRRYQQQYFMPFCSLSIHICSFRELADPLILLQKQNLNNYDHISNIYSTSISRPYGALYSIQSGMGRHISNCIAHLHPNSGHISVLYPSKRPLLYLFCLLYHCLSGHICKILRNPHPILRCRPIGNSRLLFENRHKHLQRPVIRRLFQLHPQHYCRN